MVSFDGVKVPFVRSTSTSWISARTVLARATEVAAMAIAAWPDFGRVNIIFLRGCMSGWNEETTFAEIRSGIKTCGQAMAKLGPIFGRSSMPAV